MKKVPLVIAADLALFLNMMSTISMHNRNTGSGILMTLGCVAGIALVVLNLMKNRRNIK